MSLPAIRWARLQKVHSASQRAVLGVLADFARRSGLAWPSVKTLAEMCGMCEKSVHTTIKTFAARGLLLIEGNRARRKYRLLLNAGVQPAPRTDDGADREDDLPEQPAGNRFLKVGNDFPKVGNRYRRSYKDPNSIRDRRPGATGEPVAAIADARHSKASSEPWRQRVLGYRQDGFWYGDWGAPPGSPHCRVPAEVLARFDGKPTP